MSVADMHVLVDVSLFSYVYMTAKLHLSKLLIDITVKMLLSKGSYLL